MEIRESETDSRKSNIQKKIADLRTGKREHHSTDRNI
jgi:hypothetical protein